MSKQDLREAMPTVAAIVDQYRPWLEKLVYASENGHVIDRREEEDPDKAFVIPENYYPTRAIERKK